jgi:hypothetical protein
MRIFLIKIKEHDYDEYDAFVVAAENEDRAMLICGIKINQEDCRGAVDGNLYVKNIESIVVVGETLNNHEERIILDSFNAG